LSVSRASAARPPTLMSASQQPQAAGSVAVLLNANARSVSPRVVRALSEVIPSADLFLSHSLEEADEVARVVTERGYQTVLTGGGDGTFIGFLNAIAERLRERSAKIELPRFGVLRMGTGNALAYHAGASPLRRAGVQGDILRTRAGQVQATRHLDLVEVEGSQAPFSGLGHDALILNNYLRWKSLLAGGPLRRLGEGLIGYFLSIFAFTVPQTLANPRPAWVKIYNEGAPAWAIDLEGRQIGPAIPAGELLYEGPCHATAASTCPYYGFGIRMFPAADHTPGRMALRVSSASALELLTNMRSVWVGTFTSPRVHDFQVERVRLELDRPMPFHIAGDAEGWRDEVRFAVSAQPVQLLDFSSATGRDPSPTPELAA